MSKSGADCLSNMLVKALWSGVWQRSSRPDTFLTALFPKDLFGVSKYLGLQYTLIQTTLFQSSWRSGGTCHHFKWIGNVVNMVIVSIPHAEPLFDNNVVNPISTHHPKNHVILMDGTSTMKQPYKTTAAQVQQKNSILLLTLKFSHGATSSSA